MGNQPAHDNIPTGKPIKVFHKPQLQIWGVISVVVAIGVLVLITTSQNWMAGNLVVFFGVVFVIRASLSYWDNLRTKVEQYSDAVVIYSNTEHKVFYFNTITNFSSEYIEPSRGPNYTKYTLERSDGIKMSFPDTLENIAELVNLLEIQVGKPQNALAQAIEKLDRGEKMIFSQFTATAQGITAENGEFRSWTDLEIGWEANSRRLVFQERNKPALIGGQAIWAPLPKQHTNLLEKLVNHYQTSD